MKKGNDLISRLVGKLGRRRHHCIKLLEKHSTPEGVSFNYLQELLQTKFSTKISELDIHTLKKAFCNDQMALAIQVSHFKEAQGQLKMDQEMNAFKFETESDTQQKIIDSAGYLGQNVRNLSYRIQFRPITTAELLTQVGNLTSFSQRIRAIDDQLLGYINYKELEEIIKISNTHLCPYEISPAL